MSNVEKFEELLRSDETLQAKLRNATEAFAGNKSDGREVFDAVIAPLAAEAGIPFTYDEGRAFATKDAELSDEELDAVAGGGCFLAGYNSEPSANACWDYEFGANACDSLGVGVFTS